MFVFAPFSPDTGQGGEVDQPEELFVPFTGTVDLVQSLGNIQQVPLNLDFHTSMSLFNNIIWPNHL
jgi:hypothetical protein